jgi:hypothetical protein
MPRFLGELPDWPAVEQELRKRNADAARAAEARR